MSEFQSTSSNSLNSFSSASSTRASSDRDDINNEFDKFLNGDLLGVCKNLRNFIAYEVTGSTSRSESYDSRKKFYQIFPRLLDSMFGEDDNKYDDGWLSRASCINSRRISGVSINETPSNLFQLSDEGLALLRLLSSSPKEDGSIFNVLFSNLHHPVEYKFDLNLLPPPTRLNITTRSTSIPILYTHILHKPLQKQAALDPRNPYIMVTISECFLFYFLRFPISRSRGMSNSSSRNSSSINKPSESSSFMGISHSSSNLSDHSWTCFHEMGIIVLLKGNPYNILLLEYLKIFLPHQHALNPGSPLSKHYPAIRHTPLFLHILIELWLHQNSLYYKILSSSSASSSVLCDHSSSVPQDSALPAPWTRIQTIGEYIAPTDDLLSSLITTVIYLLADPTYPCTLPDYSSSINNMNALGSYACFTNSFHILQKPLYQFLRIVLARYQLGTSQELFHKVISLWLVVLQPWKCSSWLHTASPSSSSSEIEKEEELKVQLNQSQYTEEWKGYVLSNYHFYTTLLGAFIERVRELNFSQSFSSFSASKISLNLQNFMLLENVLNVYNADLIDLLKSCDDFLDLVIAEDTQKKSSLSSMGVPLMDIKSSAKITSRYGMLIVHHCFRLGIQPIKVPLSRFRRDAEKLYDNITCNLSCQPTMKTPPSSSSTSSGKRSSRWFSEKILSVGISSSSSPTLSMNQKINNISIRLRKLFKMPDSYVSSSSITSNDMGNNHLDQFQSMNPDRMKQNNSNGLLSDVGRKQLMEGYRNCSTEESEYIGDDMLRPITSKEFGCVVKWMYCLSCFINDTFWGLKEYHTHAQWNQMPFEKKLKYQQNHSKTRINLRWVGNKINFIAICLILSCMYLYFRC